MSERGVFAVDRGVFDHPIFAPEPFTEREAWLWMVGAAAWQPTRVRVGRKMVSLERGQLAFSTRFLASKWRWPEARVRRLTKRLQSDAMIVVLATRDATQITICNYDKYAFGRRTDDAPTDAPTVTNLTHPRRKEEEIKNLRTKNKKESIPAVAIATAGRRKKPVQPLPESWQLDERDRAYAVEQNLTAAEIEREKQRFANHARASGRLCADWRAAWRNWVLKFLEMNDRPILAEDGTGPPKFDPTKLGLPSEDEIRQQMRAARNGQDQDGGTGDGTGTDPAPRRVDHEGEFLGTVIPFHQAGAR